jgi:hypothetical protein
MSGPVRIRGYLNPRPLSLLSTLEERQREMRASMGFEIPEPVVYLPLPPPAVEDMWVWYCNAEGEDDEEEEEDDDDEIEEEDSK